MTPGQCRAARALLNVSLTGLAGKAVVPVAIIWDFEAGIATPSAATLDALQKALEHAGIEFLDGDRPGVRLRDKGGGG
jgi:transcriptional regulator with XRE-family HTH domain